MESFTLVIFGVTGNLSQIKLIPTLYDLLASGAITTDFSVVGVARASYSEAEFRSFLSKALHTPNSHHTHSIDPEVESKLLSLFHYVQLDFGASQDFSALAHKLDSLPSSRNRMYYLATYPQLYTNIFRSLEKNRLNSQDKGWVRVLIEKPLGHDLTSAQELNSLLGEYYEEDQLFRLDHYLGKETMQNILTFRFGNGVFEHLMDRDHIDHIQVTASEDFGVGDRGGFYDDAGALRDVGQNHVLQMLALATMDQPREFTNSAVTAERLKLLGSLVSDPAKIIFGQYRDYRKEPKISPSSKTETFFALKTTFDNDRYLGVPVYIRAGKFLHSSILEVAVIFRSSTDRLFRHLDSGLDPNVLIYRISPNEGIVLKLLTKKPGHTLKLQDSFMQFCYKNYNSYIPDAYERLLVDALKGDQTFFNDAPEIEAQWRFIDPLEEVKKSAKLHVYDRGSWGPSASDELMKTDGRSWLEPSALFCSL